MQKISYKSDWLLATLLSLIFLLFSGSSILQSLELKAYDIGVRASNRDAGNTIAIIAIDDKSIANIGRWPWPRDVQAKMLDKLSASPPKIIGNTVFFLEPQIDSGLGYINQISQLVSGSASLSADLDAPRLNALITQAQLGLNADLKLANSIKSANNIVLGMPFVLGEPLGNADKALPDYVTKNALSNVLKTSDNAWPIPSNAALPPIKLIGESASAIGHLNSSPDIDGAIRLEPLAIAYYDQLYPSMALQLAARYLNITPKEIVVNLGEGIRLGKLNIATNDALQMNTFFIQTKKASQRLVSILTMTY